MPHDVSPFRKDMKNMKTMIALGTVMVVAAVFAAQGALVNSHGQTINARAQAAAPAPTCCYTKAVVIHLPTGGVSVQNKAVCVAGCDKPCLAKNR